MAAGFAQQLVVGLIAFLLVFAYIAYVTIWGHSRPPKVRVLDGTISGNRRMVFTQDPSTPGNKTVQRSDGGRGQEDLSMTWTWWMAVQDYSSGVDNPYADQADFMAGRTYVWHKGSPGAQPLKCPGVFFKKDSSGQPNVLEVQLNTFADPAESLSVGNLPVDKWFHCAISIEGRTVRLFINGKLKEAKKLRGIVKQNYGSIYIGENKGFPGYLSNLTQYDHAVRYSELASEIREGPSKQVVGNLLESGNLPPYFHNRWWLSY